MLRLPRRTAVRRSPSTRTPRLGQVHPQPPRLCVATTPSLLVLPRPRPRQTAVVATTRPLCLAAPCPRTRRWPAWPSCWGRPPSRSCRTSNGRWGGALGVLMNVQRVCWGAGLGREGTGGGRPECGHHAAAAAHPTVRSWGLPLEPAVATSSEATPHIALGAAAIGQRRGVVVLVRPTPTGHFCHSALQLFHYVSNHTSRLVAPVAPTTNMHILPPPLRPRPGRRFGLTPWSVWRTRRGSPTRWRAPAAACWCRPCRTCRAGARRTSRCAALC